MPSNMWFACLPLPLALTRTALEQSGARGGSLPAPLFGTCALPLLERAGDKTCRQGLGVMHGPSTGGPAQWAVAYARAVTDTEVEWWLARHRLVSPAQGLARRTLSSAMEGFSPRLLFLSQRSFRGAAGERDARVRVSFLQRKRPALLALRRRRGKVARKGFFATSAPAQPYNPPCSHQDIASWLELRILPRKDTRRSPPQ